MRKAYIFVYNSSLGTREEIKEFAEGCNLIRIWRYELDSTFFLISEASANDLCQAVHQHFGKGKSKFFISEIPENTQGWLSERSWTIINEKKLPPKAMENKT